MRAGVVLGALDGWRGSTGCGCWRRRGRSWASACSGAGSRRRWQSSTPSTGRTCSSGAETLPAHTLSRSPRPYSLARSTPIPPSPCLERVGEGRQPTRGPVGGWWGSGGRGARLDSAPRPMCSIREYIGRSVSESRRPGASPWPQPGSDRPRSTPTPCTRHRPQPPQLSGPRPAAASRHRRPGLRLPGYQRRPSPPPGTTLAPLGVASASKARVCCRVWG